MKWMKNNSKIILRKLEEHQLKDQCIRAKEMKLNMVNKYEMNKINEK